MDPLRWPSRAAGVLRRLSRRRRGGVDVGRRDLPVLRSRSAGSVAVCEGEGVNGGERMEHLRDGLEDVSPSGWDGHQLLIAGVEEARPAIAAWAKAGLCRAKKMIYAADARHPSVERLVAALAISGLDVAPAADEGQLAVVDTARFCGGPGEEQWVPGPLGQGSRGVRSYGGRRRRRTFSDRLSSRSSSAGWSR